MSEEHKPEPITFSDGTTTTFTPTPMLSGTAATLSGGESMTGSPMAQDNVKFVMGPDGQMIAVQKEPFVWKKFFIGLGVPLFLMVVPLLLSLYADSMSVWDEDYESEYISVELVNGTAYTAPYSLDPNHVIEWCNAYDYGNNGGYYCEHDSDDSEMQIFKYWYVESTLVREDNTTAYSTNFSLEEGQSVEGCDVQVYQYSSSYYCDYNRQTDTEEFTIIKETWDDNYNREQVGQWNQNSEQIEFDDGEDYGTEINILVQVKKEIGGWTESSGASNIDSGDLLEDAFTIHVETMDEDTYDEMNDNRATMDVLLTITMFMCCSAPLVAIGMIIYGFAATGGKPIGIGAVISLVAYPVIGFFTMITAMVASW